MPERKRKRLQKRGRRAEDDAIPLDLHRALYYQAYEADIESGPRAKKLAESLESPSGSALITMDTVEGPSWVDRHDILLLLDPMSSIPSTSEAGKRAANAGWDDLPPNTAEVFLLGAEAIEDFHREKRRRMNEEAREARLRAMSPEPEPEPAGDEWGGSDEEPDESVVLVMQKTARMILAAQNPTQMEMKIVMDFGKKQPAFAFLGGRWRRRWEAIRTSTNEALQKEKAQSTGLGGLADYGDSDGEESD